MRYQSLVTIPEDFFSRRAYLCILVKFSVLVIVCQGFTLIGRNKAECKKKFICMISYLGTLRILEDESFTGL